MEYPVCSRSTDGYSCSGFDCAIGYYCRRGAQVSKPTSLCNITSWCGLENEHCNDDENHTGWYLIFCCRCEASKICRGFDNRHLNTTRCFLNFKGLWQLRILELSFLIGFVKYYVRGFLCVYLVYLLDQNRWKLQVLRCVVLKIIALRPKLWAVE